MQRMLNVLLSSKEGKIIMVVVVLILSFVLMSNTGVNGHDNVLDNSNKASVSSDTLYGNAVKLGDVEGIEGDLIIK